MASCCFANAVRNSSSNNTQEPKQFRRLRKVLQKNLDLIKDHVEEEIPPTSEERRAILQKLDANYRKQEEKRKRALERGTSVLSRSSASVFQPKKRSSFSKQQVNTPVVVHYPLVKKKKALVVAPVLPPITSIQNMYQKKKKKHTQQKVQKTQ